MKEGNLVMIVIGEDILQNLSHQRKVTSLRLAEDRSLGRFECGFRFPHKCRICNRQARRKSQRLALFEVSSRTRRKGCGKNAFDGPPRDSVHFTMTPELSFILVHPNAAPILDEVFFTADIVKRLNMSGWHLDTSKPDF